MALTMLIVTQLYASETDQSYNAFVETKPRWEVGAGAAAIQLEAYPASSETSEQALALPFFVYRGERLRMQQGGVQAVAVENRRYTLDLSLGAALNVDSEDVVLREGMPDLDFLFEIGPKLEVRLWQKSDEKTGVGQRLNVSAAVRAAFSTDLSSVDDRGFVLNAQMEYRRKGFLTPQTELLIGGGPLWVTDELADYVYGGASEFATVNRPAYSGRSGYLATNITAAIQTKIGDQLRLFAAIGTGFHDRAANRNSPLFEDNFTTGIGLGLAWTFWSSSDSVTVYD